MPREHKDNMIYRMLALHVISLGTTPLSHMFIQESTQNKVTYSYKYNYIKFYTYEIISHYYANQGMRKWKRITCSSINKNIFKIDNHARVFYRFNAEQQ